MTHSTLTRNLLAATIVMTGIAGTGAHASAQPAAAVAKHIAIVVGNMSPGGAVLSMTTGGRYALDDIGGFAVTVYGPTPPNPAQEVKMLQAAIATHPSGIVLENLAPPLFTLLQAQAIGKGIPVVALDTPPLPGSKVTVFVGSDNIGLGALEAQQAIKALPANAAGSVIVVDANHGVPLFDARAKGIADTITKALRNVKVITLNAPCLTGQDAACSSALSSRIKSTSNLLAVLGTGSLDLTLAAQMKKATNGKFLVLGMALTPGVLQGIKDGSILCTVSAEQYLEGYIATRLLAESIKTGKPMPQGFFNLPSLVVDKSLVDVLITRQSSDANMRAFLRPEIAQIFANPSKFMKPLSAAR